MNKDIYTLTDLTPDPRNANRHTARGTSMIEQALQEVGAARSIVIDEEGRILAGNATVEAAAAAGLGNVQVVDADGETIIAVRRSGLTPAQKTKLALYDNRTSELGLDWDASILQTFSEELDLSGLWSGEELAIAISTVPDFSPVGLEEQGKHDEKQKTICPECGHAFIP